MPFSNLATGSMIMHSLSSLCFTSCSTSSVPTGVLSSLGDSALTTDEWLTGLRSLTVVPPIALHIRVGLLRQAH